jgi:uncharacterized phage-associated protein
MKLKKTIVKKFIHVDVFGKNIFSDVEILFDPEIKMITPENFDQGSDEFYLSDDEIDKLSGDSVRRYLNVNLSAILKGSYVVSGQEVDAIINFCKVNRSEFSDLIGLDRASVTRIIKEEQRLKKDVLLLIIERLKDEIESPGISRVLLDKIRNEREVGEIENLDLSVFVVAEYFVRFFEKKIDNITHLKLQKLLYYAQGIALGRHNRRLFNEPFLAWKHGPVVKAIYDKYKIVHESPLNTDKDVNISELEKSDIAISVLKETISLYGIYSAWALRNKTHNESPWTETEQSEIIEDDKIISYFRNALV